MSFDPEQSVAAYKPLEEDIAARMQMDQILLPELFRLPTADEIRAQMTASDACT